MLLLIIIALGTAAIDLVNSLPGLLQLLFFVALAHVGGPAKERGEPFASPARHHLETLVGTHTQSSFDSSMNPARIRFRRHFITRHRLRYAGAG